MSLGHLITPDSQEAIKATRLYETAEVRQKAFRSQLEETPTGHRWTYLSFNNDNNCNGVKLFKYL